MSQLFTLTESTQVKSSHFGVESKNVVIFNILFVDGNVDLEQALGLSGSAEETETERMIRLGEMTPFGSIMKPKPSGPHLANGASDFDKYLLDQSQKAMNVKRVKIKKKSSTPSKRGSDEAGCSDQRQDGPVKKRAKLRKSMSDSRISDKDIFVQNYNVKRPNLFDAKDKRTYWNANETDFSHRKPWRRRLHARLGHNFSEDRALSDNDEDYDNEGYMMPEEEYIPPQDSMLDEEEQRGHFNSESFNTIIVD